MVIRAKKKVRRFAPRLCPDSDVKLILHYALLTYDGYKNFLYHQRKIKAWERTSPEGEGTDRKQYLAPNAQEQVPGKHDLKGHGGLQEGERSRPGQQCGGAPGKPRGMTTARQWKR